MNESHAGTARATGVRHLVKRRLVRWFDSALVGGAPQRRYFAALGVPEEKIFEGYDAVDNDHFAARATEAAGRPEPHAARLGLPRRYFLSLGRFIPKKNLPVLIQAYRQYLDSRSARARIWCWWARVRANRRCDSFARCWRFRYTTMPGNRRKTVGLRHGRPGCTFLCVRQLEDLPVFMPWPRHLCCQVSTKNGVWW